MTQTVEFNKPTIFFTTVNILVALILTLATPFWGAVWGVWAGTRLAKLVVGTGRNASPCSISDLVTGMWRERWPLAVFLGAGAVAVVSRFWSPRDLEALFLLAPVVIIAMPVVGGLKWRSDLVRQFATRERWVPALASVFSVPPTLVDSQAGIYEEPDGTVVIDPVPSAMALKVGRGHVHQVEVQIADALPHLMLHPGSNDRQIRLIPVDAETAQRRADLAESGGLLAGGPVAEQIPDGLRERLQLRLTDEDLT